MVAAHLGSAHEVAVSPDGKYVFVAGTLSRWTGAKNTTFFPVVDVTTKITPMVRGGGVSATHIDYAYGVAVSHDGNYVFVAGASSGSVAMLGVTTKTTSVVRGGVISATYMDYAYGAAVSTDGNYVFLRGAYWTLSPWWTASPRSPPWRGAASSAPPTWTVLTE